MKRRVFITGISGMDGSYLADLLHAQGDEVYGLIRRKSVFEEQESRIDHLQDKMPETMYGDLSLSSVMNAMAKCKPDEIYNLAAQSHVRVSFDIPEETFKTNALGAWNVMEAMRRVCPEAKMYQASSSEMFGNSMDSDGYQRLTTSMRPVSPYGCAKLFAFNMVRVFREGYGLHISNGVLFNHESPRRGTNFVTQKIVKNAVEIKHGLRKKLYMGNLEAKRDWGHAKDYVKAMVKIVRRDKPGDYMISTGRAESVRFVVEYVFKKLGMDYKKHVVQSERYIRPRELDELKGDSSQSQIALDWKPEHTLEEILDEMIEVWEAKI